MTREPDRPASSDPAPSESAPSESANRQGLVARHLVRIDPASSRRLLNDVSVHLQPRQRIGLTGPSGSGKSLLLRALARLDPLDGGSLQWQGQTIQRDAIPGFRAAVMLLLQQPLMDQGTVEDQLQLPYQLRHYRRQGKTFDRDAASERLRSSGRQPSFLTQPAGRLSGGERQLVALIRALLLEPQVLLLDEPTSAMDPPTVAVAERWIADWHPANDQRSFVWVTHDDAQCRRVADTYWTLVAGRIVDTPAQESR